MRLSERFQHLSVIRTTCVAAAVAAAVSLSAGMAQAANVVVDFSQFTENEVLSGNTYNFGGVNITISTSDFNSKATGDALICNTSGGLCTINANDPDLASPFKNVNDLNAPGVDFGNALILQEKASADGTPDNGPDDVYNGGKITFTFDRIVDLTRIFILDGGDNGDGTKLLLDNVLVAGVPNGFGGGDNQYEVFDFGDNAFAQSLTVDFAGSGAVGQFGFSIVPVPASLPLLLTGLGAFAWVARRRRKTA